MQSFKRFIVIAPGHYEQMVAHKAHLDKRFGASQSDYYDQPKENIFETGRFVGSKVSADDDKSHIEMRV